MNETSDLSYYKKYLNLQDAYFSYIDHEDAMVASVFKIIQKGHPDRILKICNRKGDLNREFYFLNLFANKIPVPKILKIIEPDQEQKGAILMECISGDLLKAETITEKLARDIGLSLAQIHSERVQGYGDLIEPSYLSNDPRLPFSAKFEEGLEECRNHLPEELLKICKKLFIRDIDLLCTVDGPCIIHRDYRPGNLIVSNEKVQGIIDWSSGRGGFAEEDFCSMELLKWSQGCKRFFLDGYASVRKIPSYKPLMPILRLSKAIASIGFTVKKGTWNSKNSQLYQFHLQHLKSLKPFN